MDSLKICNTELPHGKESLVHALLDSKLHNTSVSTEENSNCEKTSRTRKAIVPNYCFKIVNYSIGENVEYEVELVQSFLVFRKNITEVYKFKTRYSKLKALNDKIGGKGFPVKKYFGNKNKDFIEKRKKELEVYLNGLCAGKSREFYNFVLQIKTLSFEADKKKHFRLPN